MSSVSVRDSIGEEMNEKTSYFEKLKDQFKRHWWKLLLVLLVLGGGCYYYMYYMNGSNPLTNRLNIDNV